MQATATMKAYVDNRLCEEVRKYPHLYNSSMKEYKYIYMGCNSWREIAQNCAYIKRLCMRTSQLKYDLQGVKKLIIPRALHSNASLEQHEGK